jgi:hypothetical protein
MNPAPPVTNAFMSRHLIGYQKPGQGPSPASSPKLQGNWAEGFVVLTTDRIHTLPRKGWISEPAACPPGAFGEIALPRRCLDKVEFFGHPEAARGPSNNPPGVA